MAKINYPDFTDVEVDNATPITITDRHVLSGIRELAVKMNWTESESLSNALMSCSSEINRENGYSQTIIEGQVHYKKIIRPST